MQSHNIFAVIILVFSSRIVKANDSSLTMLETFPDDETLISLCSCKDKLLCLPLAEALNKNYTAPHVLNYIKKIEKKEVFAFVVKCNASVWGKFDWSKLTTVALANFYDAELVCHAHQHGVKVVKMGNFPTDQLSNKTARTEWIRSQLSDTVLKFLDGINIDYEDAIDPFTPEQYGLTSLVKETAEAFHSLPGLHVSVDVAWSAKGIDGRYYEYDKIAAYSDVVFIMAYDEQSQILNGPCTARPNSGIYKAAQGIQTYLKLGIPSTKMILGVPWYGYNYPCLHLDEKNTCYIKEVPFRGCNCSDAAGTQFAYRDILNIRHNNNATYQWDLNSLSPWFNYMSIDGQQHQVWYDDESSLIYKYMLALVSGLRGVGMWTANHLDYSDTKYGELQRERMWGILP